MIILYKFDSNGFFVETVSIEKNEQIPSDCTEIKPQDGLFKGQFMNGQWVEAMSSTDIQTLKSAKPPLTELDKLKKQHTDLIFALMNKGVI